LSQQQLTAGDKIGIYRIVRKIGAGGMGEIYEAWEEDLQRRVAIKIISQRALENETAVERFKSEGRALAKLQNPHIVGIHTLGVHEGRNYIAMEYFEGLPLQDFLMVHPSGLRETLDLFRQMLLGLAGAHEAGIVHRDLKPQNVLVSDQFNAKLIDFGIAKVYSEVPSFHTSTDVFIGTINYTAPEVLKGQVASFKSDIFSMGLVFYYMLTGNIPFQATSQLAVIENIKTQELTFDNHLKLLLPDGIKNLVAKMIAKNPEDRYQEVQEVLADLKRISLDNLPPELAVSVHTTIELSNKDEILMQCRKEGFDESEIKFIVNLAADIEAKKATTRAVVSDDTMATGEGKESIVVSKESVGEAIRRFRLARSRLITQAIMKRQPTGEVKKQTLAIEVPNRKNLFVGGLVAAVVLMIATMIYKPGMFDTPAPLPTFKVGQAVSLRESRMFINGVDKWHDSSNNSNHHSVVTAVGDKLTFKDDDGMTTIRSPNIFLPPYEIMDPRRQVHQVNTFFGDPDAIFPLQVGKKMSVRVIGHMEANEKFGDKPWENTVTCEVVGQETIQVVAGKFKTLKVQCETTGSTIVHETFYYAPSIERFVLSELLHPSQSLHTFLELTSYQL